MRRLPPLNALKAFEAAARLGSFTLAADELCVTHGAVSRQIQTLEAWLGSTLFRRLNRRVELTEAGRAYGEELGAVLDRLANATSRYMTARDARPLRVSAVPTFALRWLIPKLSAFQLRHPAIEVRLTTSNAPLDATTEPFDVAIRHGPEHVPGYRACWAMPDDRAPVCHPARLRDAPIHAVSDLARHTLLHPASRPRLWPDWLKRAGAEDLTPKGSIVFEHSYQALQAAENGVGLALASLPLIEEEIATGRLVMPLPQPLLRIAEYRAYLPVGAPTRIEAEAFQLWLTGFSPPEQRHGNRHLVASVESPEPNP